MENLEDDLKNFEILENGDSNKPTSEELQSIQRIDAMMIDIKAAHLKPAFSSSVVKDALIAKRKKSRFWFFSVLIGTSMAIVGIVWLSILLEPTIENPQYLPNAMNQIVTIFSLLSDPKIQQLLVILEAISLLLIADRIISKFRIIRTSAN